MLDYHPIHSTTQMRPAQASNIAKVVWRRKFLAVTALCAGFGIAVVAASLIKPSYDASTTMIVGPGVAEHAQEPLQQARTNESLARVADSEEVIRDAIQKIGLDVLEGPQTSATATSSLLANVPAVQRIIAWGNDFVDSHSWLKSVFAGLEPRAAAPLERALPRITKAIQVKSDRNSDLIRITFRHKNPIVAAAFANALAEAFIDHQLKLFSKDNTAKFYDQQADVFNAQVKRASDELQSFVEANGTYSITQQKELLVRRESELSAALFSTRASIADKNAQAEKLTLQLHKLKPVTASAFVSSVVDSLAPNKHSEENSENGPRRITVPVGTADPPLLMVKVYQDTMVLLFKLNAELSGLYALADETSGQINKLHAELAKVTSEEAEYYKLTRAVNTATMNAEAYAARAVEEEVKSKMMSAKLSSVKIVEYASPPLQSNRPASLIALFALCVGAACGAGASLAAEYFARDAAARRRSRSRKAPAADDQSFTPLASTSVGAE